MKYSAIGLAAIAVFVVGSVLVVGCMISGSVYSGEVSGHFNGLEFINLDEGGDRGFGAVLKWRMNHKHTTWVDRTGEVALSLHPPRVDGGDVRVVFVNHSTFVIQMDGLNIVTDPVWSERSSPASWIGPRRWMSPGIRLEDLPPVDVVLISHNHYDHLDVATLVALEKEYSPVFLVPLGNREYLLECGVSTVVEMDWWEYRVFGAGTKVHFVPARHFSGRGLFDRNKTLWGGFVVETGDGPLYFAGDTGWGRHFQQIRDRFGPVRLSLLPIGAFQPEWFMGPMHISPADAVKAHLLLESLTSIGMHYGTFKLADDGQDEPLERLGAALEETGVSHEAFRLLEPGVATVFAPIR